MEVQHTKHVTYKLVYHFVWCPKYRKKILVGKLATFLDQEIRRISETNAGPFDILGFFLGYMSGPLLAESREEYEQRHKRVVALPEEVDTIGIAV